MFLIKNINEDLIGKISYKLKKCLALLKIKMQTKIPFIAIDDNAIDLLLLTEYIKQCDFFENCGTYTNANEGLLALEKYKPIVVFLDIEMPDQTGIDILKKINNKIPISVFITSHQEFALEGYTLSAFDYILKPLTPERLLITANRIIDYWHLKQKASSFDILIEQETIIIKEGYTQIKIQQNQIIYLEAMQDYTKIVTENKTYLTLSTISNFIQKLNNNKIVRVHRSYAVMVNKITILDTTKIVCGNFTVPIGKTYKENVANLKKLL